MGEKSQSVARFQDVEHSDARQTQMRACVQRRESMLRMMGRGVAVFPCAPSYLRNGDAEFPYRQDSDFLYMCGFHEPEAVLVLSTVHAKHRSILFLRPKDAAKERWDGARLGPDAALSELGVDAAFPIEELESLLPEYLLGAPVLHYRVGGVSAMDSRVIASLNIARRRARQGVCAPTQIHDLSQTVHELRLRKDALELSHMRKAARITCEAHKAAFRAAKDGAFEYEVEAELLRTFRRGGASGPAYESIVGSGPNATVLHYRQNSRRMRSGEFLLIDAGCEYNGYAADLTRTVPVDGVFSGEHRAFYELVLRSQLAAIEKSVPGGNLEDIHKAALHVLVDGMIELGLLVGSRSEILEKRSYTRFFMHKTSHWLGLDVHDVGSYYGMQSEGPAEARVASPRALEPGFVLTIEPGLYVPAEDDAAPKVFRGMGVRIEDDICITTDGHEVLTQDAPKGVEELQAWIKD